MMGAAPGIEHLERGASDNSAVTPATVARVIVGWPLPCNLTPTFALL